MLESKMKNFTSSCDGLLKIDDEDLKTVIIKTSILAVYDVDKTPLGRGKYATVCRAVHKKTGIHYAAKFVKKRRRNQDQMKEIIHEIAVLMQCSDTSRVIRLHEVYESTTEMVLVLELAAGGELQHILDEGQCLGEVEARKAMRQILDGVAYLHKRNIAHLDLKPQNLLLAEPNSCDNIKLCDFGISKILEPGVTVREILGTVDYVAPEVLSYEPIQLSTDIWSIGVLAYVLLSGFSPFAADDKQQTFLNISKCDLSFEPEHFDGVSSAAIDFIKTALVVDPRKRPKIKDLFEHPWISLKSSIPTTTITLHTHTSNNVNNLETTTTLQQTLQQQTQQQPQQSNPKSTPLVQRKTLACLTDENSAKNSCNSTSTAFVEGAATVRSSYAVTSTGCLCQQCGTACRRHLSHQPTVQKSTTHRGILC